MNTKFSPSILRTATLKAYRMGIDTHNHLIIFMHVNCPICRSEGFRSETRIKVSYGKNWLVTTLHIVTTDILKTDQIGFSERAWEKLGIKEGDEITISHAESIESFKYVRAKLYGKSFTHKGLKSILLDMMEGRYSDIQLSSFITACVDLNRKETILLTQAMSETGRQLTWDHAPIADKHCVGGLPGNRTSMIIVPILAAYGITIPKTSSRAITSPAGTADTMEALAPVILSVEEMKKVIEKEGGCIVWGGSVDLSPVDDILVQVERALSLDSSKQLVASILSKKIAAGSTCILVDMPVGPTAKVYSHKMAKHLKSLFLSVGKTLKLNIRVVLTEGLQPVGRGIGPTLEARDVLSVLRNDKEAPQDLKDRSLFLAANLLEFSSTLSSEEAFQVVTQILEDGRALKKFEAICEAQGGMKDLHLAPFTFVITSKRKGIVQNIDNRLIARIAKFAGAPDSPAAGVELHTPLGTPIEEGQPLFTIYSSSKGELGYALHYFQSHQDVIQIEENPT